jgi:hypothetical protein
MELAELGQPFQFAAQFCVFCILDPMLGSLRKEGKKGPRFRQGVVGPPKRQMLCGWFRLELF